MDPYPIVSENPREQERYEQLRREGQSHNLAEMFATRSFPAISGTQSIFMKGCQGKKWISQLGPKSDPEAWVTGPDDVSDVCKRRGYSCEGMVRVKGPNYEVPDNQPYKPSDAIIAQEARNMIAMDPGLASKKNLHQELKEKMSPAEGGM